MCKVDKNDPSTFPSGAIIAFAGEEYRLLENHGESGSVNPLGSNEIINGFRWVFEGEAVQLVEGVPGHAYQAGYYMGIMTPKAGRPPILTDCAASVISHDDPHRPRQCRRKNGHGPNRIYCKQHGKKAEEREARWRG